MQKKEMVEVGLGGESREEPENTQGAIAIAIGKSNA